jgi:8-amino-7-oxononanoate synthase
MIDLLSKYDFVIEQRDSLKSNGRDSVGVVMEKVLSPTEAIIAGKHTILVGTYNYMGMTFEPEVIEAGRQALTDFGTGTTGSRVLNGTYALHAKLEADLADFYARKHCMVFSAGYLANLALCSALTGKGDYIIIDADSHASIYDGCAMGRADIVRFRHNSADDLAKRLRRLPDDVGKLVVLEGVYSMLGDVAPLKDLVAAAKEGGAQIMVDEAHAMGFFGHHGRGVVEQAGCEADVDFIMGTFSKSVGTMGGYVVSDHPKFDVLRLMARPYVFTASLPPSVVATATKAVEVIRRSHNKRAQLWAATEKLHKGLRDLGFTLGTAKPESAIIAVIMPDSDTNVKMWATLLELGVYVNMARPPATPTDVYLLRCSLCAAHTPEQVDTILAAFKTAGISTALIAA